MVWNMNDKKFDEDMETISASIKNLIDYGIARRETTEGGELKTVRYILSRILEEIFEARQKSMKFLKESTADLELIRLQEECYVDCYNNLLEVLEETMLRKEHTKQLWEDISEMYTEEEEEDAT